MQGPAGARLPEFFIAGHPKCGTTALYTMLRGHPQIYLPENKEPRYFAMDHRSRRLDSGRDAVPPRLHTLEGYLELFADARKDQRPGEASTTYLMSRVAAQEIAQVQPQARVIAILREPASFLRSLHLQWVSSNVESEKDFGRALALEDERRRGERIPSVTHHPELLFYSDHVRYAEQLRRFSDVFGPERVLVLVFEEFRRENDATLERVLRFLDVDDTYRPPAVVETASVPAVRFMPLHAVTSRLRSARSRPANAGPVARGVNALLRAPMRSGPLGAAWRRLVYTERSAPDDAQMRELRVRFKSQVEAVSDYLGRDLVTLWHYDEI